MTTTDQVTTKFLDDFADAWNRHDVEGLMTFMTQDCVFMGSIGPGVTGSHYAGFNDVKAGYAAVFKAFPDAHWGNARHFVAGDRGVSEWTFTGTTADGKKVEVNGCDIFTFLDGKIQIKDSYRKQRTG